MFFSVSTFQDIRSEKLNIGPFTILNFSEIILQTNTFWGIVWNVCLEYVILKKTDCQFFFSIVFFQEILIIRADGVVWYHQDVCSLFCSIKGYVFVCVSFFFKCLPLLFAVSFYDVSEKGSPEPTTISTLDCICSKLRRCLIID